MFVIAPIRGAKGPAFFAWISTRIPLPTIVWTRRDGACQSHLYLFGEIHMQRTFSRDFALCSISRGYAWRNTQHLRVLQSLDCEYAQDRPVYRSTMQC